MAQKAREHGHGVKIQSPSGRVSAVIPNWERAYNLKHVILPLLEKCPQIDEIIISHGRPETVFDYPGERCRVVHRRDYQAARKYGLARRFLAAAEARNDVVLSLDDDVIVPAESLFALYDGFARDPDVIHSLYGRNPDKHLGYCDYARFGEVTYALSGAALLPKRLARAFFDYAPLVETVVRAESKPLWNGEDLFLSLVALKVNRRLNRAYPLARIELRSGGERAPSMVSASAAHLAYRSRLSRRAIAALHVGDLIKTSPGYTRIRRARAALGRLLDRWS